MSVPFIGIFMSSANAPLAPTKTKAASASRDDMVTFQDFKVPVGAHDWAGEAGSRPAAVAE
jgi:hypothetical protein